MSISKVPKELLHQILTTLYPPTAFQPYAQTMASSDYDRHLVEIAVADNTLSNIATAFPRFRPPTGVYC